MAKKAGKFLKSVHLHQALFWKGVPNSDSLTLNEQKISGLKMWIEGDFLNVEAKGKSAFTHVGNIKTGVWDEDAAE